jgi:hypothetical protein
MAKTSYRVQHMIVCGRVSVGRAEPGNPYTLHDVRYTTRVEADREFPVVEPEMWVFVRFVFVGKGKRDFIVQQVWLDAPGGESECGHFTMPPVLFGDGIQVVSRAWKMNYVNFPGEGRYAFRLAHKIDRPALAQDIIEVWRDA